MATPKMQDERDEKVELQEGEEFGSFDEEEATPTPEAAAPTEDDVPEKYKGKTPAELIAMHQEAERFAGKQGSEVGELRKSVDQLIQAQLSTVAPAAQPVEEESIDFFDDPDKALEQRLANHPSIKAAEETAARYAAQTAQQQLIQKHPEMNDILGDEKFALWVKASPVRTRLFQSAHSQYDVEAADELFSTWKERKQLASATASVEAKERKQQIKAANTGSSSASSDGGTRKKMYRRADVIRLMRDDPDRYRALAPEIMQAYAENRVIA